MGKIMADNLVCGFGTYGEQLQRHAHQPDLHRRRDSRAGGCGRMSDELAALRAELARQQKTNAALMRRVERDMNVQGDAFSLFQAATVLEKKVHERTAALEAALDELQHFNRELRAAKEAAEAAARSKDEFLAGMSHELRTPLNAVLGLSELLQEEICGPLNEKQNEALRTIATSGRHLLSLINDILEIARMGSGEVQLRLSKVLVAELCEGCVDLIRAQARKKEITVTCEITDDVPELKTDARRFKQVLVNLLGNAVKIHGQGRLDGSVCAGRGPVPMRGSLGHRHRHQGGGLRAYLLAVRPGR